MEVSHIKQIIAKVQEERKKYPSWKLRDIAIEMDIDPGLLTKILKGRYVPAKGASLEKIINWCAKHEIRS